MNMYSPRIGRMTAAERAAGRYMRAPDHGSIDITADLTGGADDAGLGDLVSPNAAGSDTQLAVPPGTVPKHGAGTQRVGSEPAAKSDKAEPTLRDQLSSAFKAPESGAPTDQQQAQSVQPPEVPALTKDGEGKYRQTDGTFASAEQIAAFEAAQAAPGQSTQQAAQSPILQGMTPVEQQQFQSLPAELRQLVERTMEGLNTRGARYGEYDLLEQVIGPRREAWAQQGMAPAVAVNQLFALSDYASQRPGDFVLWFAEQNKLDLDALLDARDAQAASVDPQVAALQAQVQQLQGNVQQFTSGQQQQEQTARLQLVQDFAAEKDEAGGLKRPYLTDVMGEWTAHITALRTAQPNMSPHEVLQKAYEAACWANPTVRAQMQQASDAARRAEEARRASTAKAAGATVTGGPAGDASTQPNNANRSLRDDLKDAFAAARAV